MDDKPKTKHPNKPRSTQAHLFCYEGHQVVSGTMLQHFREQHRGYRAENNLEEIK